MGIGIGNIKTGYNESVHNAGNREPAKSTSTRTSRAYGHRKVNKESGLSNTFGSLLSSFKQNYKDLKHYVCKSLPDEMKKACRSIKHEAKCAYLNLRIMTTSSKMTATKYRTLLNIENGGNKVSGLKDSLKDIFK